MREKIGCLHDWDTSPDIDLPSCTKKCQVSFTEYLPKKLILSWLSFFERPGTWKGGYKLSPCLTIYCFSQRIFRFSFLVWLFSLLCWRLRGSTKEKRSRFILFCRLYLNLEELWDYLLDFHLWCYGIWLKCHQNAYFHFLNFNKNMCMCVM